MKNKRQSQNKNYKYKIKLPKMWTSFKNKALACLNMQEKTRVILYISYPRKYHENFFLCKNKNIPTNNLLQGDPVPVYVFLFLY